MNGSVVRVRREPEDTTAAIDDEENFSANQVQSGALEDWVNGKLESTLPADVDTAAATYSLRKAKADYSGDAVRIRRTSDSVEVNVAFDSDDKVSTSSSISVVSGETNATTVAEFLSEERTTFVTNPVFSVSGGGGSITQEVTNTSASFSFQGGTNNFIRDARKPANLGAETGDTISFDVTASGVSTDFSVRLRVVGANTDIISPPINDLNNGTRTITLTVGSNSPAGYFAFTNLNTAGTGTVTIDNLKVVGKSATVHTWYDQAGSNNAVQETDSKQPLFAESGALTLNSVGTPTIKFVGGTLSGNSYTSGKSLRADGLASAFTGMNEPIFVSAVSESVAEDKNGVIYGFGNTATDSARLFFLYQGGGVYGTQYQGTGGADFEYVGATKANTSQLFTNDQVSTLANIYNNSVPISTNYAINVGTITLNTFAIGAVQRTSESVYLDGNVSELIIYSSDQSDNRFKIESNINNYYGLYNDAKELTEDFEGGSISSSSVSGQTFVANGKDGFTVTTSSSATGEGGFTTIANVVAYKISFNAKLNGNSVNIARRLNKHSSGAATQLQALTEGFNTYDYASASSIYTALTFTCSDNNATFTISDFKISGIARNGFVETWYDQSGNSNDAVQASAGNQPAIVQNGGLVTDGIRFETDNELETGGNITASTITGFVVANLKGTDANSLYSLGSDSSAAPSVLFGNPSLSYAINGGTPLAGGTAPTFANSLFTQLFISGGTSKSFIDGSQIASGDAGSNTASSGKITIGNLASSTRYANIAMNELIVFTSDKSTDQDEIEEDISRNYNITLS